MSSVESQPIALPADAAAVETGEERNQISIPLSLFVVHDEDGPSEQGISSRRTEADLEGIASDMAAIWAQANITFDPVVITTIVVPAAALVGIVRNLDTQAFFDGAGTDFDIPNLSAVNGFYVRAAGLVNGFAPSGSRVFFVVDEPSVHDERVSSHEVGHIFGLHHQLEDASTLMFSGTNGTTLTPEEQTVSRYFAQGVLDGLR